MAPNHTFCRPILWKVGEPQPKSAVPSPVSSFPDASLYIANTFRPRLASSCTNKAERVDRSGSQRCSHETQ